MGEDGNYVIAEAFWAPDLPYPGNNEINRAAKEQFGSLEPRFLCPWILLDEDTGIGCTGADTLDNEKIETILSLTKSTYLYGKGITFDKKGSLLRSTSLFKR